MATGNPVVTMTLDVLNYVFYRHRFIAELPQTISEGVDKDMIDVLRTVIWVQIFKAKWEWNDFLIKHHENILRSKKLFAKYCVFCSIVKNRSTSNVFDRTIEDLTIMITLACHAHKWLRTYEDVVPEVMEMFFRIQLNEGFIECSRFTTFNEYLQTHPNMTRSRDLEKFLKRGLHFGTAGEMINWGRKDPLLFEQRPVCDIESIEVRNHKVTTAIVKFTKYGKEESTSSKETESPAKVEPPKTELSEKIPKLKRLKESLTQARSWKKTHASVQEASSSRSDVSVQVELLSFSDVSVQVELLSLSDVSVQVELLSLSDVSVQVELLSLSDASVQVTPALSDMSVQEDPAKSDVSVKEDSEKLNASLQEDPAKSDASVQ